MASEESVPIVPVTISEVSFHEATLEERNRAWEVNGISWAGPLSVEQYVGREAHLSETALCRNPQGPKPAGTKYWVVTRKSDGDIVAACESTLKTVLIADQESGYREGRAWAIASVYTPARYRKQGMAGYLLNEVKKWFDGEGDSECSALYSDIGVKYYAKLGWPVYPYKQGIVEIKDIVASKTSKLQTKPLKLDDLPTLCEKDTLAMIQKFQAIQDKEKTHIAFTPSYSQVSWHLARTEFMAKLLLGTVPEVKGAITQNSNSWIYWDHDLRPAELTIIRIATMDQSNPEQVLSEVIQLLEAAVNEASEWKLPKIGVWNPDELTTAALKEISERQKGTLDLGFEDREDHAIPSLRWREDKSLNNVVWDSNEYYAWC